MREVIAAADIGSNTAHLLVARIGPRGLERLANVSEWLSLGQVVSHEGVIPRSDAANLAAVMRRFRETAHDLDAGHFYVFATEAVRRARNHRAVLTAVRKETGVTIDLISPQREAELGLKGVQADASMTGRFVLVEAGGGSVQVAHCQDADLLQDASLPLGTGVLIDKAGLSQPLRPAQSVRLKTVIDKVLTGLPAFSDAKAMVACGGVARGLWRALHPDLSPVLHRKELEYLAWSASRLGIAAIARRFSVKPKRAATLVPGSLVYLALMERFGFEEVTVSAFGVREGAVLEISQGKVVTCRP
ncbi:MAG: hypothetical protein JST30_10610 [Armatimonadetes bacterium]|nr:hypothetical protein [Armatimonadota bacterium]